MTCWCWINLEQEVGFVIAMYVIYWVFIIYNIWIIYKVVKFLKESCDLNDPKCDRIRRMCYRLYMYPFVITICFFFATFHRIYQKIIYSYVGVNDTNVKAYKSFIRFEVILYLLHGMFMNVRGFLIFVVYGFDSKVRDVVREQISNMLCWKNKKPETLLNG